MQEGRSAGGEECRRGGVQEGEECRRAEEREDAIEMQTHVI